MSEELTFGISMSGSVKAGEVIDPSLPTSAAVQAEQAGFDSVWMGDHIFWHGPKLEALTSLCFAAAATTKIRIGTSVLLLAMRNLVVAAKELSSLDYLSGGRLDLGIGIGGENPAEWEACGVPLGDRVRRTEEGVEILRHLFSGDTSTYAGEFHNISDVELQPLPTGPVPILFGGRKQAAQERSARLGDGWLGLWVTADRFSAAVEIQNNERARLGLTDPYSFGMMLWTYVTEDIEGGRLEAAKMLGKLYGMEWEPFERYLAVGTPEQIAETVQDYLDRGCSRIVFNPIMRGAGFADQVAALGSDVLPLVRKG